MKTKATLIMLISLIVSCGPKVPVNKDALIKEVNTYASKVDNNNNLKEEMIEGALTDTEGFKDIGTFKYTVYFNEKTKRLFKIKNVETTAKIISETYYFKDGDVILIDVTSAGTSKKLYLYKGRLLSDNKTETPSDKLLLKKAKLFQKSFQKEH